MAALNRLGKYEILDLLGVGGMGTVYRARDPVLERIVAVKLLHRERDVPEASGQGSDRFLYEARAVARLNHPSIVSVYDFSDADPAGNFFAMEYVDGCTIEDYVRFPTDVRLNHALALMRQLLGGLAYAHGQGVMHRDVKPSNLLVTHDRRLKITDFGIAKIGSTKQTMTGMMLGTPAYMAPERYRGGDVDLRCDLYSAGVVFYELLTGRRPFRGEFTEVMYQICHVVPSPASAIEPAIPASLDPVLARALAKNPDERYQTAAEFAAAVNGVGDILNQGAREAAAGVVGAAGSTVSTAGVADTGGSPVWSAEQLAGIEQRLTPILGPMARIVVKRAAALTQDPDRLREELLAQLRTDDERERFLRGAPAASSPDAPAPPAPATNPLVQTPIQPATLERTAKVLMRYIGPIGAVLVRKAAPTARDEADLVARLAERISDGRERTRFLAEMARR